MTTNSSRDQEQVFIDLFLCVDVLSFSSKLSGSAHLGFRLQLVYYKSSHCWSAATILKDLEALLFPFEKWN